MHESCSHWTLDWIVLLSCLGFVTVTGKDTSLHLLNNKTANVLVFLWPPKQSTIKWVMRPTKNYFLPGLEARSLRSRCRQGWFLPRVYLLCAPCGSTFLMIFWNPGSLGLEVPRPPLCAHPYRMFSPCVFLRLDFPFL